MPRNARTMRGKIQLAISLTSATVVLVTVAVLLLVQYSGLRRRLVERLHSLAATAANTLEVPVAFDAPEDASETLQALRTMPDIRCVSIFRPNGTVFLLQSFDRHDPVVFPTQAPASGEEIWQGDQVLVAADISSDDGSHGTLWIACGLETFRDSVHEVIFWGIYLYIMATVVAFLVAWLLQRAITRPILELTATADRITREGPSSIRADWASDDETGRLVDSFNHMLDHIATQNRRLEDREHCYRTLFSQAAGAVFLESEERQVIEANHTATTLLGCPTEALLGRSMADLIAVPDQPLPAPPVGERVHLSPAELTPPEGEPIPIDLTITGIEDAGQRLFLTTAVDITDRLRAQELLLRSRDELKRKVDDATTELREANQSLQREMDERRRLERQVTMSEKVKSLGLMAGGIAHDFNNLLQAILGNVDIALGDIGDTVDEDTRTCLREAKDAARTAANLATQMLAYAGKGALRIAPVNVNGLIHDMKPVLDASAGKSARGVYVLADGLPSISADEDQLRQVLMHLVVNAAEAMPPAGGTFTIRTAICHCDREFLRHAVLPEDLPPGEYLAVSVEDDGEGIESEIVARIFDPFFTTKFIGRGLGLAAVLGIVRAHRAAITLATEPGKGSTFTVYLPIQQIAAAGTSLRDAPTKARAPSQLVLVADDEEGVRHVSKRLLGRLGLDVKAVASGEEAVEACRKHGDAIRLYILDASMTGITGSETARRILRLRPDAQIVLASALREDEAMADADDVRFAGFLRKPFEPDTFPGLIREALSAPREPTSSKPTPHANAEDETREIPSPRTARWFPPAGHRGTHRPSAQRNA